MAYSAMVRRLLVAAPGDVPLGDVAAVFDAVNRWNVIYGPSFTAAVVPVHWSAHAAAEHGERAQEVLNRQLADDCDAVVALFWHRLGSWTGIEPSGTVEEVRRALGADRYVGILQCTRDLPPDVDTDQLRALREFFDEVMDRSLVLTYDSEGTLTRHVDTILAQLVTRDQRRAEVTIARADEVVIDRGAEVWPRVESTEHVRQSGGRVRGTEREWTIVLTNTGNEPAHDVTFRLEAENTGDALPRLLDDEPYVEALAPTSEVRYRVMPHWGSAVQVRCRVLWADTRGDHETVITLRFI